MGMLEKLQVLLSMNGDQFKGDVDKSRSAVADFKQGLKEMAMQVGIGAIGIGTLVQGLKFSVEAAAEAERIQAQLGAVLKSTGWAAGMSADGINDMAVRLSELSAVEDDAIVKASAVMLTFTKIGEAVFPDAMEAALNMSAALGTDLQGSVIQLGKALNDPIQGVSALRRVGVSFTEDQQALIKSLVESNDLLGAQRIVLDELAVEFGGAAAAMGDTFTGKVDRAKNALGNLGEKVGEKLLPTLGDLADGLVVVMTWSERIDKAMEDASERLAGTSGSYEEYTNKMLDNFVLAKQMSEETREHIKVLQEKGMSIEHITENYELMSEGQFNAIKWTQANVEETGFLKNAMDEAKTAIEQKTDAEEEYKQMLETVNPLLQKYTEQLLFNTAAANMDAEGALALARSLGLVDERTAFMLEEQERLQTYFDTNQDGFVDAEEATQGYIQALHGLDEKLKSLPAEVPIHVSLRVTGGENLPNLSPGGIGGPDIVPMARGGDFMVRRPTLFLAGEAGPERATFTPAGKAGPGSQYEIHIYNELAGAMWLDDIRRQQASEAERRM